MKLKTGDKVKVIAGKDKGKETSILKVFRSENKILAEGVNIVKKHIKAGGGQEGGILEMAKPIDASNVAIIDPKSGKATRIAYKFDKKGKKVRVSKDSGSEIK